MAATPRTDDSPETLFHLRWVARIALWVGAVAAGALFAADRIWSHYVRSILLTLRKHLPGANQ